MRSFLILIGACLCLSPAHRADGQEPPESVLWESMPAAALYWTRLPGPQFESAILRTSDGRGVVMTIDERLGNFARFRLEDASGVGWATYVGPQKFNQDGAIGRRVVRRVEGLRRFPPPTAVSGVFGGVSVADVSGALTLVYDDGGRVTTERRLSGVGEADVAVNGAPVTVDVFLLQVTVQDAGSAAPIVAQAAYAPALGAAIRGQFVEPKRVDWSLDQIQVSPELFGRLQGDGPGAAAAGAGAPGGSPPGPESIILGAPPE